MDKGQVFSLYTNSYEVKTQNGIVKCSARNLKKNGIVVGDRVLIDNNVILKVEPRSSFFIRPNVANVDCVNIVISKVPKPDYLLVDKIIATAVKGGAKVILTVNKSDLGESEYAIKNYAQAVDKIFTVSALNGEGIDELKGYLQGKLVAFAGQSAVGKTTLVNKIFSENFLTGELSKKTERGKNTTTRSKIVEKDGIMVVDTPGFTGFYMLGFKCEELPLYYPEFADKNCYYRDCMHLSEHDCGVKEGVKSGEIPFDRYERYKLIYKEIKDGNE